jgi:hypothetical protein
MSGIQVLHGVEPKPSRLIRSDKPLRGTDPVSRIQSSQHARIIYEGYTFNSPFTYSSENLFPVGVSTATYAKLPRIQSEGAANPVPGEHFVKVQPHEKGSTFATNQVKRPIVYRSGGPAKTHDTAATPNHPSLKKSPPPKLRPVQLVARNNSLPSFLQTAGTLSGHATADTNHSTPRWNVTKKGVIG